MLRPKHRAILYWYVELTCPSCVTAIAIALCIGSGRLGAVKHRGQVSCPHVVSSSVSMEYGVCRMSRRRKQPGANILAVTSTRRFHCISTSASSWTMNINSPLLYPHICIQYIRCTWWSILHLLHINYQLQMLPEQCTSTRHYTIHIFLQFPLHILSRERLKLFWKIHDPHTSFICNFWCDFFFGKSLLWAIPLISSLFIFSSDRSSYSDGGLLYMIRHFLKFWAFLPIYLVFLFENWMQIDYNWPWT